ncbi:unnamed protein product [Parnassius mnemosyne]|uniref:Uncharacterized protein n=1 Tax=Parnassius mnemosyne TaxID=213953 RepID=A0AAV1M9J7_9NEOP
MNLKSILTIVLVFLTVTCNCNVIGYSDVDEARGKKKKIALFVYWADIVIKKIFVLKLIYAFVFWVVIHKAGYFLTWFISYLKEKKHEHHDHHAHYIPHHHYDYEPPGSYGPPSYEPYRRQSHRV